MAMASTQRAGTCSTLEERPEYAPLPSQNNRYYLAEKAKFALKWPKSAVRLVRGVLADVSLYQVTMTAEIRLDEWLHDFRWFYKAEVSFDMSKNPPMPFLSTTQGTYKNNPSVPPDPRRRHTLNPFPPGHIAGLLRRPDVIIVMNMFDRWPGRAGPDQDGVMHGENLQRVVEVKFPDDSLGDEQRLAYEQIAGGRDRFSVCDVNDCDGEREKRTSGNGSRVPNTVPLLPPVPRNDTGAGGAPVPVEPEPKPKPKPGTAPVPSPNGAQRIPAPIYSPVPTQETAWYERLGSEAADIADAIARAFSRLSDELRAKLAKLMPWIEQKGRWIKEQAHDAWIWVNEKGEQVARWTKEQLMAAWEAIARETDLRWEQIKSIDWGQVLLTIGEVVAAVVLIVAAGIAVYAVIVLTAELLVALVAILSIVGAELAGALALGLCLNKLATN